LGSALVATPLGSKSRRLIMSLYLNEIAPWERKNEYYKILQLGKDSKQQSQLINTQTKAMISSQLASANSIIASQDRIIEGINNLSSGIEHVEQSIYDLKATFEWGISEVVWQLEQNRKVLKDILEVLMSPLDTKAKERKKRANEAYTNGWIEDAEEEYLESEKLNKYDFSIHISLGMIYLFEKIDKEKALSYFSKAVKYARPKSSYYTSYSLLYYALINFDLGEIEKAEEYTQEAIALSPDFLEAYYQNAQYNAKLKNHEKSITQLENIIKQNKLYCLKANKDPLFEPIREYVNKLFEKLRDEEKDKALKKYYDLVERNKNLNLFLERFSTTIDSAKFTENNQQMNKEISNFQQRINRDSYFDFIEINDVFFPNLKTNYTNLCSNVESAIWSNISKAESPLRNAEYESKNAKSKHKSNVEKYGDQTTRAILIGSFIVPALVTLLFADGWSKLFTIVFCIPVISQLASLLLVGELIFNYSEFSKDQSSLIIAWSIVIYLFSALGYFLLAKFGSKSEMETSISNVKKVQENTETSIKNAKTVLSEFQNCKLSID